MICGKRHHTPCSFKDISSCIWSDDVGKHIRTENTEHSAVQNSVESTEMNNWITTTLKCRCKKLEIKLKRIGGQL